MQLMASREREGECGKEEGVGDPTMVSRCACQRQLKPPGGTTRSNVGVVESWWTCSCYILPNSGPRRRTLGLGKRAASKIVARPRRGKICSTLQRQSGGIWAGTSPGWGSPSSDVQGVAGCPTSRGGGGATAPHPHLPPPGERTGRILLAHCHGCGATGHRRCWGAAPRAAHYIHVRININIHVDVHVHIQMCHRCRGVEEVEEKEPGAYCCWPTTVIAVVPLTTGAAAPRAAHYIHIHINIRV